MAESAELPVPTDVAAPAEVAAPAPAAEATDTPVKVPEFTKLPPEPIEQTMKRAAKAVAEAKAPAAPAEAKAGDPTKAEAKVIDALEAPKALKDQLKEQWGKLPKEWQQEFIHFNSQIGAAYNKYGKAAKAWEGIDQAWAQNRDIFGEHVRPQEVFQTVLQQVRALKAGTPEQRLNALGQLIQDFELLPLVQGMQNGTIQAPQIPQRDNALWQELSALKATIGQQREQEQASIAAEADQSLEAWQASTKPVHFDAVADVMVHLLQGGQATDFQDAYEKACWQHAEVRPLMVESEVKGRLEEARKKAEAARSAAISPRADGLPAPQPLGRGRPESVEESMARARAALGV